MKKLVISGLHGERNVTLNMRDGVTIIMSDNGVGKTTTLNILYYILSLKLTKLAKIHFDSVDLTLSNGEHLLIERSELDALAAENVRPRLPYSIRHLLDEVSSAITRPIAGELAFHAKQGSIAEVRKLLRKSPISLDDRQVSNFSRFIMDFPEILESGLLEKKVKEFLKFLPFKLVYLPTYRRVEEDLANLGILSKETTESPALQKLTSNEDVLIHFGMDDVTSRFSKVTQKIKDDTMASYSKISGGMLDELLNIPNFADDSTALHVINENKEALSLVLKRIGSSISDIGRTKINDLVGTGEISDAQYQPLAYFLGNLIRIYETQRVYDDRINKFVNTANDYLRDKELTYDEVDPKIEVVSKKTRAPIDLEKLSSGEKQLISILSLLYLEEKDFGVIFDEPELSLSTDWQEKLLPDIMKSGQCKFLLAATHSPYIYSNEYVKHAKPIKVAYTR